MNVCFITVHYNTPVELINYLNDLEKFFGQGYNIQIVIVDSGSGPQAIKDIDDYLVEYKFSSSVSFIKSEENIGYLKGLNRGIDRINESGFLPDYWILGNNDVYFDDDFLQQLASMKINEDVLILAPNILNNSGIYENPHERVPISKIRMLYYDLYYSNYLIGATMMKLYKVITSVRKNPRKAAQTYEEKNFMPIHFCTGCKFILTPNFFNHYKKLRDDVFLWAEEVLIAYQVWSINKTMLYCPNLKMRHLLSVATGKLPKRKKYKQMQEAHWKVRKFYK